jgi:intracellular sulfur oxidation DsrE/DsrF family protein
MRLSRKSFVTAAALGASATALARPSELLASGDPGGMSVHFHVLRSGEYDRAKMMEIFAQDKPHKQVFQDSGAILLVPGIVSAYIHMQNSMNAHEFSLGYGRGSLATLAVLMGPAIVLGLNDAMWTKYGFGQAFKVADTNVYYKAASLEFSASPDDPNGIYQDWSAEAILHRGGAFMVCHNAMTFVAAVCASAVHGTPQAVLADFKRNMLPGFQIVPAGVAAVQLAQQHAWTLFAVM